MATPLSAERAALSLAQGKAGTLGLLLAPSGKTEFLGFGYKSPVQALRLTVNGKTFSETTNPFNLIMRRGKPSRPSWAVLADADWNTLCASDNTNATISCIALIEPPSAKQGLADDGRKLPLAIKAHFAPNCGGVVVLYDDYDFCNLIAAECASMPVADEAEEESLND